MISTDPNLMLQQALASQRSQSASEGLELLPGARFKDRFSQAEAAFTDLNALQGIRQQGNKDPGAALEQIAKQFESMLVQTMLKSMRSANSVFTEGSMFDSSEMQFHQDMFDQQLGLSLSQGRGFGLAEALMRQLKQEYSTESQGVSEDVGKLSEAVRHIQSDNSDSVAKHTLGMKQTAEESAESFVKNLESYAVEFAEKIGVDPKVLIAQAALETGWGKHLIHDEQGNNSHNLFNIKADKRWQGDSVSVPTLEYENGLPTRRLDAFRQYDSYRQSFADYVAFLQDNPRYQSALAVADDPYRYVQALQDAGYATDPQYAKKIQRIFDSSSFSEHFLNIAYQQVVSTNSTSVIEAK